MNVVRTNAFSPFQIQMLELTSRVQSTAEMDEIRRILGQYFADKAQQGLDRLWDEGKINDQIIDGWKHEHMRTPY